MANSSDCHISSRTLPSCGIHTQGFVGPWCLLPRSRDWVLKAGGALELCMALVLLLSPSVPPQKTSPSLAVSLPLVSFTPHKAARMAHIPQGHSLDGLPQEEAVGLPPGSNSCLCRALFWIKPHPVQLLRHIAQLLSIDCEVMDRPFLRVVIAGVSFSSAHGTSAAVCCTLARQ